jgi:hypothetical protein
MLEQLREDLERLGNTTIEVYAHGRYPVKQKTPVQHVAKYQNDGTETIRASRFVQRAAGSRRGWQKPIFSAVGKFLFKKSGNTDLDNLLSSAGNEIAQDINNRVDRIKTGRLKTSMRAVVIEGFEASVQIPTRGPGLRR